MKSTQQAALALQLLKKLEITPQPMFRQQSAPIEPLTLFQKMGVGQLDLYILSPSKSSPEYQTFMQKWPNSGSITSKTQTLPLTALTSVSVLLVWHPACPQEKVVRVLFAGVTPQANLLQGLEKLKGLTFLQRPTVTTGDLERLGEDKKAKRTDSQDSGISKVQESVSKLGKDRSGKDKGKEMLIKENGRAGNGVSTRDSQKTTIKEMGLKQKAAASEKKTTKKGAVKDGKKEESNLGKTVPPKPKNENKAKIKKEAKNDSKTGVKKTRKVSGKEENNSKKAPGSAELTNNNLTKLEKIPESSGAEQQRQNSETRCEDNASVSKVSTPEDMTADFLRLREETVAAEEKPEQAELGGKKATDNRTEEKDAASPLHVSADQPKNDKKHATVVGFPLPLNSDPRDESSAQLDTTPTEFTLLDGALKYSPSSRPSPETQVPGSPEEETVEPDSPDSRPNSAGHTPYCLSPDDVWCNRATLSRIQAQMADLESDVNLPTESSRQSEDQTNRAKNREKHLSFMSLGSLKDGSSDPSPSVATTTTTHSMPAEVSSPQSTEVDESLSMSLEQGPTTASQREGDDALHQSTSNGVHFGGVSLPVRRSSRALGQGLETGRPVASSLALHFEASAHDVDLCLVSPCEFKHFKPADTNEASKATFATHHHGVNNNNLREMSPSESNIPVCMEDCPSTTLDGALDSDDEESCSEPSKSPRDTHSSQALPQDPPPAPFRDSPPLPPHPDVSMPVPQPDSEHHGQRAKTRGMQGKKSAVVSWESKDTIVVC